MDIDAFISRFFPNGETDIGYLRAHFPRFLITKATFDSQPHEAMKGKRLLDIGAHWLHQSMLWRADGYEVTAADVGLTMDLPSVREQARSNGIRLISYPRLDDGRALTAVDDGSIDVVLFCEILEHITFNPMAFWGEVYRVLAVGGRIVITTPNCYWLRGRFWNAKRLLNRGGSGLPVQEILRVPTFGPHWKEYSLRECVEYFDSLSHDLRAVRAEYIADPRPLPSSSSFVDRAIRRLEDDVRFLRWGLHLEVEKSGDSAGMAIVPSW